jgi:hypothetical protein
LDNFNPLLLVKDFDSSGPMKTDMTFMSNADVPVLALSGQVEKMINPFTGREISSSLKEKPLYIAVSGSIHLEDPMEKKVLLNPRIDHYVHDNIFDPNNWTPVEK